jgi:hypothetical protein
MDEKEIGFPLMYRIEQHFEATSIKDIAECLRQEFARLEARDKVQPGQNVAVAVGSRGIHDLVTIVATAVECLRGMQLKPFIIPAMGSHGGATSQGQAEVLYGMGITESAVGAPIVSNMDTISLGRLDSGAEVFCAQDALEADHLVVINRVKPHTVFRGEVESGLCKMLAIGLGKKRGASNIHKFDLAQSIVPAALMILEKASVLCGLAIVENPSGGTHTIRLALPNEFVDVDRELLKEAWRLLPRIPLEDLDILIIDEMGKNISGAGIDPNVIGFWRRGGGPRKPDYRTLIVLDLTPESHGNATGIGMADLTTRRVIDKVDLQATYTNAITSWVLRSALLPIALENDRNVLEAVLNQVADLQQVRMARIVSTLELQTFWATEALLSELREQEGIIVGDRPLQLEFDTNGRLLPFPN